MYNNGTWWPGCQLVSGSGYTLPQTQSAIADAKHRLALTAASMSARQNCCDLPQKKAAEATPRSDAFQPSCSAMGITAQAQNACQLVQGCCYAISLSSPATDMLTLSRLHKTKAIACSTTSQQIAGLKPNGTLQVSAHHGPSDLPAMRHALVGRLRGPWPRPRPLRLCVWPRRLRLSAVCAGCGHRVNAHLQRWVKQGGCCWQLHISVRGCHAGEVCAGAGCGLGRAQPLSLAGPGCRCSGAAMQAMPLAD